jgi:hypothetical protein
MQIIPLQQVPRQEFSITLDGVLFNITLQAVQDCMYATISANNSVVVSGARCVASGKIIPFDYLEGATGNFTFLTLNDELPWWTLFGNTQQLIYASASELATLRAS